MLKQKAANWIARQRRRGVGPGPKSPQYKDMYKGIVPNQVKKQQDYKNFKNKGGRTLENVKAAEQLINIENTLDTTGRKVQKNRTILLGKFKPNAWFRKTGETGLEKKMFMDIFK